MIRRDITRGLLGAAAAGALASEPATGQTANAQHYPRTAAEIAAAVAPVDLTRPAGTPERYGAAGDGNTDDTKALQDCIRCNSSMRFTPGALYAVQSIAFGPGRSYDVDFNGAVVVGTSATAQHCIIHLPTSYSKFCNVQTATRLGATVPNSNYACSIWMSNGSGLCQWNSFYRLCMTSAVRGMVYGALPGDPPAQGDLSENAFYGFSTIGVENPFYSNATEGFAHFSEPIFYSGHENWHGVTANYATARALEIHAGAIFAQGGEIEIPSSASGYAADLRECTLVGMYMETANPLQIVGPGVNIMGGIIYNLGNAVAGIRIAGGWTGIFEMNGVTIQRQPGVGAYSGSPMIDATAAGEVEILLKQTKSREWRWTLAGGDARLVNGTKGSGTIVRYVDHDMKMTAGDSNIYTVRSPGDSLLDGYGVVSNGTFLLFDRLGYTRNGWQLNVVAGNGSTLELTHAAGPTANWPALQLTLHATGNYATADTLGTAAGPGAVQASCLRCRPGELYWLSCWIHVVHGGNGKLALRVFNASGIEILHDGQPAIIVADSGSLGTGGWTFAEGPSGSLPAGAAFLTPAIYASASDVSFTDLRIRRAN
jgi:hypothetical protein